MQTKPRLLTVLDFVTAALFVLAIGMVFFYARYLMLRQGIEDPDRRARFGSVYAIVGFVSVPLTFFSARLFRTIHPIVIGTNQAGAEGDFDMTPMMLQTFMFSLLTFTFVFADLLWD